MALLVPAIMIGFGSWSAGHAPKEINALFGYRTAMSMAQYVVSREESVHALPENVSLLSAALTEPLACGVHAGIEKGEVSKGDVVCIFGVGAIGQMVAQVSKARGATVIVAGLSSDQERFEIALANGADRAVDQSKENLLDVVNELTDGVGVDIAFECSGAVPAANKALEITRRKGRVVQMGVFPEAKELIWTDLILHKEICYVGSRSQKPSSWRTSIELLAARTVVPEKIVTNIVSLADWREGFEATMKSGEGREWYLSVNDAAGYGEPNTLVTGILLMPIMLGLAFILPGNTILPMVETPAAVLLADRLARHCDFFSVGSNDLIQYTTATDRQNERVQNLYDCCNISFLRAVRMACTGAHTAGIPIGICGETASEPRLIPLWAAMIIAFLVPYGLISSELGTTYQGDGGLYDWISKAFPGSKWGARASWYYWINFPLWMASLAVMAAVTSFFQVMKNVSVPRGAVVTARGTDDYTQYTALMSLQTGEYFISTYENPQIKKAAFPASASRQVTDLGALAGKMIPEPL